MARISPKNDESAFSFQLNIEEAGALATDILGSLSKARRASLSPSATSTEFAKYILSPSDYAKSRFSCCAMAWPQFARSPILLS